jgi:hypothetical protein
MPLTLVVPHLLPGPDAPGALRELRLPAIERALARADTRHVEGAGHEAWLTRAFGLADPAPVAAVTLAHDAGPRAGSWLRADPVHLALGAEGATLHDASILDVTRAEADALIATLQATFSADGLEFSAPAPDRWYVRVPPGELPRTTPLARALGHNALGLLPRGTGRINWAGVITEAQMLLSTHGVNAEREGRQRPAINSLWLWGEGDAPTKVERAFARVHAADALSRGLARLAGVTAHALPESLDDLEGGDAVLVVDERLARAYLGGDEGAWAEAARALDATWFARLDSAAARFGSVTLVLPAARDTLIAEYSPAAKWRWLRARRTLASHA